MKISVTVAFCAYLCHLSVACTRQELVLIQVISNHGNAAPQELYPTDPNPLYLWREGLGELTKLGKFQSFAVGGYLRARYNDFITSDPLENNARLQRIDLVCHYRDDKDIIESMDWLPHFQIKSLRTSHPAERVDVKLVLKLDEDIFEIRIHCAVFQVEVRSCPTNACIMSALCEASSLYVPTFWHEIVLKFPWQPIMVKYNTPHEDKVFSSSYCPAAEQEYRRLLQSPEAQQLLLKYKGLFDYWSAQSGWEVRELDTARTLYNVLDTEKAENLTLPQWAIRYGQEMSFIANKFYEWRSKTAFLKRLRAGPLVKTVIGKMLEKSAGLIPEKKVFLYTTNQDNLASLLSSLELFDGEELPPCATVVMELYNHNQQYYVRILYLNSTTPEQEPQFLHLMNLYRCTEFCPLDYVVNYTKDLIPNNWNEECAL